MIKTRLRNTAAGVPSCMIMTAIFVLACGRAVSHGVTQPLPSTGAAILSVEEVGGFVELKTSELTVRVQKSPWQISVFDKTGRVLTRESAGMAFQYGDQRVTRMRDYASVGRVRIVKRDPPRYHAEDEAVIVGESVRFNCETTENEVEAQVHITFRAPGVFSVWMTVPGKARWTREVFESSPNEHFFGLGECWDAQSLDLKGLSVTMSNRGGTPDQGGYVPFYVSTRGYGILVDNYLRVNFSYEQPDAVTITAPPISGSEDGDGYFEGTSMLWYFYYGPDMLDVIDRYTDHVSRPAMPPSWALFTTWQWRDTSDETAVYEDANGMREAEIPCGLIWVDRPWATGDDNMPPPFEWEAERFPNGHKMFMDLNEMGYKTGVWVAKNLYGDMDDPALVRRLKTDAQPWLRNDNCQMYKIDRGNTQRMDPYFTCQAYWETWDEVFKGDFVTLPRVIAFRGQKYVNGKWPGDNRNKYEYPSGLRANIGALLNFAIAGFPFWGSDTGGFPDPKGNEVTGRWAEFSSMCPIFQTAGTPYRYPEQYRDIYRKYAEHYTRLFPYRWTYAKLAHEKGHPICRALALHYPDDADCYSRKYEYLFGEWILVAPMVDRGTEREVYLPEGKWIDWWDGTVHAGPSTITCPAPLDKLPMFVKAGAIVPMIDVHQTWLDSSIDRLTLRVYPEGASQFTIEGDDKVYPGRTEPYTNLKETEIKCHHADNRIDIDISPSDVSYMLEIHCNEMPVSLRLDGDELKRRDDMADLEKSDSGWTFAKTGDAAVWVKVPGETGARHATRMVLASEEYGTAAVNGEPSICASRSGNWSDPATWYVGFDDYGTEWRGVPAGRLPDGTRDEGILIGDNDGWRQYIGDYDHWLKHSRPKTPRGVTVTLDVDVDTTSQLRINGNSTLIIPSGSTLKIDGGIRPDRTNSMIRQTGGTVITTEVRFDDETCQYVLTGGSLMAESLNVEEGSFIIDDSSAAITSISVAEEFRTDDGDGDTTTKFIAHSGGVTPIRCKDLRLESDRGETLIVDVSKYDYAKNGDLVLFSYRGKRSGKFTDGREDKPQVTVVGAKADLVYDDAGKTVKLTNFRP